MHPPRDTNNPGHVAVVTSPGDIRYTQPIQSLRPCRHGHGLHPTRATHAGMTNGAVATRGCEQHMRQWVVDRTNG